MQTSLAGSPSGLENLNISKFLIAGGASGMIAAVANVVYNVVREGVTDRMFDELNPAAVILTSVFTVSSVGCSIGC